ncbi:MAG: tRNA (guanosine(37)-N1)-methyltransferase TrmD, partial [Candidatus Dadabacteria bacterium]
MQIDLFTLFPAFFESPLSVSLPGRAIRDGVLAVRCIDFRKYATDRHRTVDDTPYGGGPGMLLRPEPIVAAFEDNPLPTGGRRIYLTPWGRPLRQPLVEELAALPALQMLCGRYEGVDERVIDGWIDDCIS